MERHVVNDANREVVDGLVALEVVVHSLDLRRRRVLRAQTVAAGHDDGTLGSGVLLEQSADILIHRLAESTGLLAAVEHSDLLDRRGQHVEEVLGAEGAIQVDDDQTDLLAAGAQIIDRLFGRLAGRAHADDDAVSLGIAVVVEGMILAARQLGDVVHVLDDRLGQLVVERIAGFAGLEEDVGVLSRALDEGMLGVKRISLELGDRIVVDQLGQILIVKRLDLLN